MGKKNDIYMNWQGVNAMADINELKEKVLKEHFKDVYQLNAHNKILATITGEVLDLAEYHTLEQADRVLDAAITNDAWQVLDQQASSVMSHEAAHKVGANPFGFFANGKNEQKEEPKSEDNVHKKLER